MVSLSVGAPQLRNRRLARAAVANLTSRGFSIAAVLVLTPLVIHGVGVAEYGAFSTITSLAGVAVISDLGIGAGLVARLSNSLGRNDVVEARCLVSTAWWALICLGVALAILVSIGAVAVPWARVLGLPEVSGGDAGRAVLVFGLALGLGLPLGLGDRLLSATQKGAQSAGWALGSSILTLGVTALAAREFGSLVAVVAAASMTPRLCGLVQTWFVMTRVCPELAPRYSLASRSVLATLQSAGALFLVQGLVITVAFQSDMLVVSSILGAEAAAVYSVNMRVLALVGTLAVVALGQLFPAFGEALACGDMSWVRRTLRRLTAMLIVYVVVTSTVLLIVEPIFISWWVGSSLVAPRMLLIGLVTWTAYTTILIPANMLMNAALVIRFQIIAAIAMALVNLPLSVLLTRQIGVAGPAWGSMIAHVAVSLVPTWIIARRVLRGESSSSRSCDAPSAR